MSLTSEFRGREERAEQESQSRRTLTSNSWHCRWRNLKSLSLEYHHQSYPLRVVAKGKHGHCQVNQQCEQGLGAQFRLLKWIQTEVTKKVCIGGVSLIYTPKNKSFYLIVLASKISRNSLSKMIKRSSIRYFTTLESLIQKTIKLL